MRLSNLAEPASAGVAAGMPSAPSPPPPGSDEAPFSPAEVSSPASGSLGATSDLYPAAARAQGVEADVHVVFVLTANGRPVDVQVTEPVGFGFEEAAKRAVLRGHFVPARRGDRAVAVRMPWVVHFVLR
jgi:TonB family protein